MTTLVVGASGTLCRELCRRLAAQGHVVRTVFFSPPNESPISESHRAALTRLGVEVIVPDGEAPLSWPHVLQGVRTVISTACCLVAHQAGDVVAPVEYQDQINLINAALHAHINQFIYLSFSCTIDQGDDPSSITVTARAVEDCVRTSGLTYTILRPACLMESWLSPAAGFDYSHARARIYGLGTRRVSYLAMADLIEFVVQAVDNPAAHNLVMDLGGPEALSQYDVVRIFEEVSGQSFMTQQVSMESLQAERAHAVEPRHKSLAAVRQTIAQGDAIDMHRALTLFPVEMTTVRDYAHRVLVG